MSWVQTARPLARRLTAGARGQSVLNLGLHLFSTALGFVASVLTSRLLGADGLGVYSFCFAVASFVGVVGRFGLQTLMVREIAVALERREPGLIHGMVRWAERSSFVASALASGLVALVGWWLWSEDDPDTAVALAGTGLLVVSTSALVVRSSALQGLHRVTAGQIPGSAVRPLVWVLTLWLLFAWESVRPWAAVAAHALGYAVAWLVALALWRRYRPEWAAPRYRSREWMASAVPLAVLAVLNLLNTQADILMLKILHGNEATGVYAVASQIAHFTAVVLTVVNAVIAPRFASLYARGDMTELQRVVTRSITAITLATLPAALVLIGFAPLVLGVWGAEFVEGTSSLVVLVVSQVIHALCGSVGTLMVMCGHEKEVGWVTTGTALLNVALNFVLIPAFGATGAATATTISLVLWNAILVWRVRRLLGLDSTILAALRPRVRAA